MERSERDSDGWEETWIKGGSDGLKAVRWGCLSGLEEPGLIRQAVARSWFQTRAIGGIRDGKRQIRVCDTLDELNLSFYAHRRSKNVLVSQLQLGKPTPTQNRSQTIKRRLTDQAGVKSTRHLFNPQHSRWEWLFDWNPLISLSSNKADLQSQWDDQDTLPYVHITVHQTVSLSRWWNFQKPKQLFLSNHFIIHIVQWCWWSLPLDHLRLKTSLLQGCFSFFFLCSDPAHRSHYATWMWFCCKAVAWNLNLISLR